MANIPTWAHVSPSSGSGNGTTNWTADANTARNHQRSFDAYYVAGSITRTAHIIQAGADLFINGVNPTSSSDQQGGCTSLYNASNAGGNLSIQGTTNAKKITYSLQSATGHGISGSIAITLPSSYTANSSSTDNGDPISGDPGYNTGAFSFTIPITIPQNPSTEIHGCVIHIVAEGDTASETVIWDVTIVQAAGDAYLFLDKLNNVNDITVNIPAAGTPAQTVAVLSNTSWTITG